MKTKDTSLVAALKALSETLGHLKSDDEFQIDIYRSDKGDRKILVVYKDRKNGSQKSAFDVAAYDLINEQINKYIENVQPKGELIDRNE